MVRGENFQGMRYCGFGNEVSNGRNWHGVDNGAGRMYRCMCMPTFRLGDGRFGPNGFPRRKAYGYSSRPDKYNIGKYVPDYR